MNTRLLRFGLPALLVIGILTVTVGSGSLLADDDDDLQARPFAFVGAAGDCGPGYPAGSRIVTAAWLGGMGLPDNGGPNVDLTPPIDPSDNPNKTNPHRGLLLSKNGTTADCSAAGAEIRGVRGMLVTPTFELGFDYRNGGHCGAGATRFNVVVRPPSGPDTFHFVGGCSNDSAPTGAPQDPAQWTRVRFQTSNPGESFPVIPPGSRIRSITLIHDEGTDTATNDTEGVGLAVLDNIFINGTVIPRGRRIGHGDDGDDDDDDSDHN